MKMLVTGATGYIGGRLVPRLLEAGHEVHAVGHDNHLVLCTPEADAQAVLQTAIQLFSLPPRSLHVHSVSGIPRTAHGKVDYAALRVMTQEVAP